MATLRVICYALLATSLVASSAYAQDSSKPLNLTVPPSTGFPQASAANAAPTSTSSASVASASTAPTNTAPASTAPGMYYGDTSGTRVAAVDAANPNDATDGCDNKAQVHGNVSTGVVGGNHFSGAFQTATVNITKPIGDCSHPSGGLNISVSAGQGQVNYGRGNH